MCVKIRHTSQPDELWNPDSNTICLPHRVAPGPHTHLVVRALLAELGITQPRTGARCWCGDPIAMESFTTHQSEATEVMAHGA